MSGQSSISTSMISPLTRTGSVERSTGQQTYYGDQTAFYGYGNDTWRITPTITLNFGLRYEFTSVPVGERAQQLNIAASVPGLVSFHAPQPGYTNFAPRLGINWAPDEKTSVRAGFGMAYDVLFDNLGTLSFPPQYSTTQSVDTPCGAGLVKNCFNAPELPCSGRTPGNRFGHHHLPQHSGRSSRPSVRLPRRFCRIRFCPTPRPTPSRCSARSAPPTRLRSVTSELAASTSQLRTRSTFSPRSRQQTLLEPWPVQPYWLHLEARQPISPRLRLSRVLCPPGLRWLHRQDYLLSAVLSVQLQRLHCQSDSPLPTGPSDELVVYLVQDDG